MRKRSRRVMEELKVKKCDEGVKKGKKVMEEE